jgi:cold-inducible RNA-binding protein
MSADPDLEKTAAVAGPSLITVQDYPPTISKRPWEEFMAQDEIEAKKLKPEEAEQEHSTSNRKIYIGNLPPSVTEKPLVAHFRTFGHVINCSVVRDKEHGISRGFAFLTFLDDAEAAAAAAFENHKLDGNSIRVSFAHAPGSGGNVIKTG